MIKRRIESFALAGVVALGAPVAAGAEIAPPGITPLVVHQHLQKLLGHVLEPHGIGDAAADAGRGVQQVAPYVQTGELLQALRRLVGGPDL